MKYEVEYKNVKRKQIKTVADTLDIYREYLCLRIKLYKDKLKGIQNYREFNNN